LLDIDGRTLATQTWGRGRPSFLLLHGMTSSKECWGGVAPALAERGTVVAIDLPGHGESPADDFSGTMTDFAAVVRGLVARLELTDLTLVGHSMGGQIAMTLALETPAQIQRLVLVAPAGIETFTAEEAARIRSLQTPQIQRTLPREILRRIMRGLFSSEPPDLDARVDARLERMASDRGEDYAVTLSRCVDGMLDGPVYERLSSLRLPVFVAYGEDDLAIPNRVVRVGSSTQILDKALAALPHARRVLFPKTGHMVPEESPALLSEEILRFLGS
jgi:pimeloyl-ACP methyl ester carboxylesterase